MVKISLKRSDSHYCYFLQSPSQHGLYLGLDALAEKCPKLKKKDQ